MLSCTNNHSNSGLMQFVRLHGGCSSGHGVSGCTGSNKNVSSKCSSSIPDSKLGIYSFEDPKMKMFCFQCQETFGNKGCTSKGMCGKAPQTANLQDDLIYLLKQISLASAGEVTNETGLFIIKSLFMTITNANFDDAAINRQINAAKDILKSMKGSSGCAPHGVLSEKNEDLRSLKELITYGLKGIAAYAEHAAVLGKEDNEIYKFTVKALGMISQELPADKLIELTLETGNCAVKTMALLDNANTSTYGNPEITKVKIGVGKRPGILISGHDLRDLKDLLEQTKDMGIDIYTHGEMLPAHYYPELKKYPHLYGNYGNAWFHQNTEFAKFNGPILMTTNCITPVQKEYKNRIFTTGVVGYTGVKHIPDRIGEGMKDFSEIIALAKKCKPPTKLEDGEIIGGFAHNQVMALSGKIVEAIKAGHIKKFVVMAGCDGRHTERQYFEDVAKNLPKDTIILTSGCAKYRYNKLNLGTIGGIPRVLDAGQCNDSYSLAVIALKLKEAFGLKDVNDLPLAFDIAWYEQKAVAVLLALLSLGFKHIRLGPTLPAFVSPGVAKVLIDNFGIMGTTDYKTDVKMIVQNK